VFYPMNETPLVMKNSIRIGFGLAVCAVFTVCAPVRAQMPIGSGNSKTSADTAIIFQPTHPLITTQEELAHEYPNSWGFSVSFSDYGFAGGMFLGHSFNQDLTGLFTFDFGTAEGSQEVDFLEDNQVNRVFVLPLMLSLQYRVFRSGLSDNLRPYITAGAGPVVAMATPDNESFFTAFGDGYSKIVPGGFVGVGANFGTDTKSCFGASIRYFIIPYPGSLESTTTESLTSFSGLYISVVYGFNF
jgi:hypothetical protein